MTGDGTHVNIRLKDNKPMYRRKEVILPDEILTVLLGKGEKGVVIIPTLHLKYKDDGKNN